jgi:hypothetical protein
MSGVLHYEPPIGSTQQNPPLEYMEELILHRWKGYWNKGSGDAILRFQSASGTTEMLILSHQKSGGFYLRYIDRNGDEWLSLADPTKLKEVTIVCDNWNASVGLILPKKQAWIAIKHFCETGQRTDAIPWIRPADIPKEGNW